MHARVALRHLRTPFILLSTFDIVAYYSTIVLVKDLACVARLSEEECSHRSSVPAGLQAKRAQKPRLSGTQVFDSLHTMLRGRGGVLPHLAESLI